MKTDKHKFLGYFQTEGSPVCITNSLNLKAWEGAEIEDGGYWNMINTVDTTQVIDIYNDKYLIFNTDTGNFIIFTSSKSIVIAEAIYMEDSFAIPWVGLEFDIVKEIPSTCNIEGLIAFFDSALSINDVIPEVESIYKVGGSSFFDLVLLRGAISKIQEIAFKDAQVHLVGVRLYSDY